MVARLSAVVVSFGPALPITALAISAISAISFGPALSKTAFAVSISTSTTAFATVRHVFASVLPLSNTCGLLLIFFACLTGIGFG